MGLLYGYPEEVSIPAPIVTNKHPQPINENNAERSYSKNITSRSLRARGPLKELEPAPPPQKANKKSVQKTKRGTTRGKEQNLQYLDGSRWVPAVYHHNIRDFLIKEASRRGKYTYPRERGPGRYDVTSFIESQKNWGPVRDENWADILYDFQKGKNHRDPTYELMDWKFYGKVVISAYDDRPMRRFRDLPDTLSSALHGRDMEAMKRTDPRIRQRDFMARMPLRHTTHAGTRRSLQSASCIGMRMTRFRQQEGMLSWIGRDGSKTLRDALWKRLPPENKAANSIRGLEPPSLAEQLEIKKGNAGKFLNRAGRRALSDEERARRKEIAERRLKKRYGQKSGSPEGGVSDDGIKGRRPANKLDTGQLTKPTGEESEHHAGHRRPDNRSMQCPPTDSAPSPGNTYQPEQDHNQVVNPSARGDDTANSGDSFVSNLPAPPQEFDVDSFLIELNALAADVPSPPRGWELESIFSGLPPAAFNNGDSSQSNHPGPPEGWNCNYSLPASRLVSDHRNSSPHKYPSPPDYNFDLEEAPLGESQQPYYLRPPQRS